MHSSLNWSEEEEERLRNAVIRHGESNWNFISSIVGTRNAFQCRIKWRELSGRNIRYRQSFSYLIRLRMNARRASSSNENTSSQLGILGNISNPPQSERLGNIVSNEPVGLNTDISDVVPWSDALEARLCELYLRDDIVDIFWGQRFEEHNPNSTSWQIYVVTRLFCPYTISEDIDGQTIHFIEEAAGFLNAERLPQDSFDPLPTWEKVPQDLQMVFDEALENELGQSFRDAHYNLVGMSTGYKQTDGQFTAQPAIILYVCQKGILRHGCDGPFPKEIRGFPVDVVEACVAIPCGYHGEDLCQRYQTDVKLGSSVGIGLTGSEKTTGTLGAVVYETYSSGRTGILSCEHVFKFKDSNTTKETIYQPSREDLLDNPSKRLADLINQSRGRGARIEDFEDEIDDLQRIIDRARKKNSTLAVYEKGMRKNFLSRIDYKYYGIDAALGIFVNDNRTLYTKEFAVTPDYFEKAGLPGNTHLKGAYNREELKNFDSKIFKVGRTTGLSVGKYIPYDSAIAVDLKNDIINYAKENRVESEIIEYQDNFIGYMKASISEEIREKRRQCYPIKWFDRQMMFQFRPEEFKGGDSGSSAVDEEGIALGLLHAEWKTSIYTCGIASPYFAIFEALNINFYLTDGPVSW